MKAWLESWITSISAFVVLAIVFAFLFFSRGCAHADDFDILVTYTNYEVVIAQPIGHVWGEKENPPLFRHVFLGGISQSTADFLSSPLYDDNGTTLALHRYTLDPTGVITDRKTSTTVSVEDVSAARNSQ